ncbi:hypothetical protein J2X20_003480 [Pelomonas saccharophila]|uniref:DUF1223 domain-containing protein n=1 Tax=Roseateles saccharophilus TaxID=304 RepID=A0ABU1YPN3_ROSSA|nr:DUF1223 domain-containing protein [Roseateles saccharophilus]MDR7270822.1 hypothetical protein [Roseateles saccharophilus]
MKLLCLLLVALALPVTVSAQSCPATTVQSGATVPRVVELYTSEGCSSCPPADRWLSSLKSQPGVIAAAFHVDYWNGLGWPDRFSSPAFTERQKQGVGINGSRYAYTPQIVINGRDWRSASLPAASTEPARVRLAWNRSAGGELKLSAEALAGAPSRIQLWWARVEDGHQSHVRAGENRGETLWHDSVVRVYARLPAWDGQGQATWTVPVSTAEAGHASRWIAVATDARDGHVLQAVEIGC